MEEIKEVEQPKSLEECFIQLVEKLIDNELFKNTKEESILGITHFSLGMWMRNNWYLWWNEHTAIDYIKSGYPQEKPLLVKYFNEVLGIFHADDMSGIIIISYHRYLNKKELNLEEQAKKYQDFWYNTLANEGLK